MASNCNMLSNNESILNTEINNKGFALLNVLFKENGWHMVKNEMNWICFTKFGHETEFFDIKIEQKNICVSIPLKNISYQYVTYFNDYFLASEYIESRFNDFIEKN